MQTLSYCHVNLVRVSIIVMCAGKLWSQIAPWDTSRCVSPDLCYLVKADKFLCTVLAKKLHKYADQI